jgi:hypothetical protein
LIRRRTPNEQRDGQGDLISQVSQRLCWSERLALCMVHEIARDAQLSAALLTRLDRLKIRVGRIKQRLDIAG